MEIRRFRGSAAGRNRAVEYNGLVWTVATAPNAKDSVAGQTRQCLAALERSLEEAGSGKTRILSAQIFLVDMATKPEMDEVWNAWIGPNPDHWPQRACVGAALADGCLVEIILLAAKS
jgi:enamine deaminase RidA (YjgF/YER057c/UK114 family)